MKKATLTRKIEVSKESPFTEGDYKNRHCKYHVKRRYLKEDDSKFMSFENMTLACLHLVMVKLIPLVQDLEVWKHHRVSRPSQGTVNGGAVS